MIHARFAPLLFSAILSGFMSCMVSAISTWRIMGSEPGFVAQWLASWGAAWAVAFPTILFIAPLTRKLVEAVVARP